MYVAEGEKRGGESFLQLYVDYNDLGRPSAGILSSKLHGNGMYMYSVCLDWSNNRSGWTRRWNLKLLEKFVNKRGGGGEEKRIKGLFPPPIVLSRHKQMFGSSRCVVLTIVYKWRQGTSSTPYGVLAEIANLWHRNLYEMESVCSGNLWLLKKKKIRLRLL